MSKLNASTALIIQPPPKYLQRDGRDPLTPDEFSKLVHYQPGAPATLHAAMRTLVRHHGASEVLRAAKIATGDLDQSKLDAAKRELTADALRRRGRR